MSTSSILIIGLGSVLLAPIARRIWLHRFDPFEPIVLFVIAWAVMFVVRPTAMLVDDNLIYSRVDISGTLPRALLLASVGAVSFLVAYELHPGRAVARHLPAPRRIETSVGVASLMIMTGLSFLSLLAFFKGVSRFHLLLGGRSDELGRILQGSSTYLWYGSVLIVPAALVSFALALRERRVSLGLATVGVFALALLRVVPLGNRIFLLPLVGGALVFVYVRRGARPGLRVLATLLAGSVFSSYVLLLHRYPDTRSSVPAAIESIVRHPSDPFRSILRGADAEMAPALAGALRVVPKKLGYRYGGAVLGDLVLRPIPRQLWRGKPPTPGQRVVATAFPSSARYLDPDFSPLLFFYWDFWIAGVVVGMALFGIAARTLYEWFLRFRRELGAQLVFAVGVWFTVIGARDDPVDAIIIAAFVVLPLMLVSWLAQKSARIAPAFPPRPVDVLDR